MAARDTLVAKTGTSSSPLTKYDRLFHNPWVYIPSFAPLVLTAPSNPQATTDVPASFFGTELARAYPEAKVVILNREREKWYNSCMTSIYASFASISLFNKLLIVLFDPTLRQFGMFMHKVNTQVQRFDWPEREKALAFYDHYYNEWRREIPRERVLEYRIQDGWGPLCKHLGIPVPMVEVGGRMVEAEFPRLNDGASMRAAAGIKMQAMRRRVFWKLAGWVQTVGFLGLLVYVSFVLQKEYPWGSTAGPQNEI